MAATAEKLFELADELQQTLAVFRLDEDFAIPPRPVPVTWSPPEARPIPAARSA
jgi:hypothetical protein